MNRFLLDDFEFDTKVIGTLIPSSWNEEGRISGLILEVEEDEEYHVEMDHMGKSLLPYVKKRVEVAGPYWPDDFGNLWIKIDEFQAYGNKVVNSSFRDGSVFYEDRI